MIPKPIAVAGFICLMLTSCNQKEERQQAQTDTVRIEKPIVGIGKEIEPLDKSPLDIAWHPHNYPLEKFKGNITSPALARVIYSRPHLNGRVFGKDVAMPDTLWRMGANENTEIEFFKDVIIDGKKLAKGRYILFCMPHVANWELFFSTDINTWGLKLDSAKARLKTTVPVQASPALIESLTMEFVNEKEQPFLNIYWGNAMVKLPISF